MFAIIYNTLNQQNSIEYNYCEMIKNGYTPY